jgi:hypothetical protein
MAAVLPVLLGMGVMPLLVVLLLGIRGVVLLLLVLEGGGVGATWCGVVLGEGEEEVPQIDANQSVSCTCTALQASASAAAAAGVATSLATTISSSLAEEKLEKRLRTVASPLLAIGVTGLEDRPGSCALCVRGGGGEEVEKKEGVTQWWWQQHARLTVPNTVEHILYTPIRRGRGSRTNLGCGRGDRPSVR